MKFTRPTTHPDSTGKLQRVPCPPRATILAQCGAVTLWQRGHSGFSVTYGLQRIDKERDDSYSASAHFGICCMHQAECEGLLKS